MNENVTKDWKQSGTIFASVVALGAFLLQAFNFVEVTMEEQGELTVLIGNAIVALGGIFAILGAIYKRFKANTKLKAPFKFLEPK